MPRVVDCSVSACFLKGPDGIGAKFCQECGASAASKVTIRKTCSSCSLELADNARFCSECGTRVEADGGTKDRLQPLIDNHKKREVTTGRGLTAAEARRIEEAARRPSKVSDPGREYEVDPAHAKIMGIQVPEADNKANQMAKGRRAIQNPTGKHVAGGLSGEAKLPADYHEGVRVIPYRFSTPAKRGSQLVTGGTTPGGHSSSDDAFFNDNPEDEAFFNDDIEEDQSAAARDVRANKARRKQAAAASEAAAKVTMSNKPPPERKKCHECGRIMNAEGECGHCIIDDEDVTQLEGLWKTEG